jgi:hypothetical protein
MGSMKGKQTKIDAAFGRLAHKEHEVFLPFVQRLHDDPAQCVFAGTGFSESDRGDDE